MIVVDTSALMAIIQDEPRAPACVEALRFARPRVISAGTLTEALVVATARNLRDELLDIVEGLDLEVAVVDALASIRAANAYRLWGKGNHPARLNLGDCFAYQEAAHRSCPLLYVGNDFAKTDVQSAI